jgi:predicted ATP-dependent serine protease
VSLFSGAEKSAGKSTFLAAASAAITRGKPFIDAPTCTPPGAILWVSADEEHTSGIVTRLQGFKAKLKRLALLYPSGTLEERLTELEQYVRELRPTLVIIDTLSNFARVKDPFGSTEWPEIILRVKRLAREQNVAAVLVHHTTKADDEQYRDSSSIGATVDQKVTLSRVDQKNSTSLQRWLKTVGRCTLRPEDVCIELTETGYAVVTNPTVDLAGRIRSYLATHPNVSQRALEQAIGGNSRRFRTMLKRLVEENDVARRQVGRDVLYALNDGRGVAADELAIS